MTDDVRLVFVTQRVDPDDPVLGATVAKIAALAAALRRGRRPHRQRRPGALPANCRVRTVRRAARRLGRGLRFGRALVAELARRPRPAAVLAHMCPIYAVLAAPLARPLGVRVLLWYAQWNRTRMLDAVAARVSTAWSASTGAPSRSVVAKVVGIGHGIDVSALHLCAGTAGGPPFEAGRARPLLGLEGPRRRSCAPSARARARALDVRLRCHGTATSAGEDATLDEPRPARRRARPRRRRSTLGGPIPRSEVPALLAALVRARQQHALGRARTRSSTRRAPRACRCSSRARRSTSRSSTASSPTLRFPTDDAERARRRDRRPGATLDAAARAAIGATLRERVRAASLDRLVGRRDRAARAGQPRAPRA